MRAILCALACLTVAWPASGQQAQQEPPDRQNTSFQIAPRGYIQLDWRGYPDWNVTPGTGRLEHHAFEVRRLRAGVDGQWRRVTFEVTLDPQDIDGTLVKDAYAQVRINRAVRIRAGQFKLPSSAEYQTSARTLDFMERSALASSIAAGRDIGVLLSGRLTSSLDYEAGLFKGDGNGRSSRAGITLAGRLLWAPGNDVTLGASLTEGRTSPIDSDPANGLEGRSSSGYRFFERVYVQGRRTRTGVEARWAPGRWRFAAEGLRAHDERAEQGLELEDLPGVAGLGWSASVLRQFGRRQGGTRSRLREWDLGIRYDGLSFDDDGPNAQADSVRPRATNVRAKGGGTVTGTASWSPMRWTRIVTSAGVERFDEARSAPEAGRRGSYWTFGTRLQFELP